MLSEGLTGFVDAAKDPNSVPLIPIDETALNPTQTNAENDLVLDVRFTELLLLRITVLKYCRKV